MEFHVGDRIQSKISLDIYEVVAIHEGEMWVQSTTTGRDSFSNIYEDMWIEVATPFFEVSKNYTLHGVTYTVHHVHEMTNGRVAVVQDTDGQPYMLREWDYRQWFERGGSADA